ncbi:hypothetical protein LK337_0412 [Lactococcus lactis subsp. lactis]|nr:hypothetical protein LK337_0412 [Lactococcus lactis subsp. lactis]
MSFLTDALSLLTGANYSDYNTILLNDKCIFLNICFKNLTS